MKKLVIFSTIALLTFSASARSISKKVIDTYSTSGILTATNFDIDGDKMVFSQLPKKTMNICITDEYGNVEMFTDISRRNNAINIANLPFGRHTITIKHGDALKTFGYFSGIVVKAAKSAS